ncbi:MAG TPA: ATP-binding cassette domain-containing protein [Nocardioidaceae bacterium]|nr:ATP-binding cassette domain-containing protein [Nocardioidaceae bacterium]
MTSTSTSGYAVEADDLRKAYRTGRGRQPVHALDGLGFAVEPGTVYGLLGPNGAGKSTTVRILSTLSRADSGRAWVAGADVGADPDAVRHRIGLVSQRPSSDPMATGRENLVLAARIQGLGRADARARAGRLLDRFGIADAADRLVRTWSGGMARKLDVAIGLVHRPQVLFLDEPTTGLDPEARAEMWAEVGRLAGDDRMTVLLTTHYLDEADRLAHRLAIIESGRVAVEGTPEQLKSELRGDLLQVELDLEESAARAAGIVGTVAGVTSVLHEGRTVRARTDAGARVVPVVVAVLGEAGIEVASATVARPSLEDVYLRHAGRSFESTDTLEEVSA